MKCHTCDNELSHLTDPGKIFNFEIFMNFIKFFKNFQAVFIIFSEKHNLFLQLTDFSFNLK